MTEAVTQTTPFDYHNQRVGQLQKKFINDPAWVEQYKSKTYIFYRSADPETDRRAILEPLNSQLKDKVMVDGDGRVYASGWRLARIPRRYHLYQNPQRGRDYHLSPPGKHPQRLTFAYHPRGIDVLLRTAQTVADKYRLGGEQRDNQANQLQAIENFLPYLEKQLLGLATLTSGDLDQITSRTIDFLDQIGLVSPKVPEKRQIMQLLLRGFWDKRDKKNFLAGLSRRYGIKLQLVKRSEGIKSTLSKYIIIADHLAEERKGIINRVGQANLRLGELLKYPALADFDFAQTSHAEKIAQVKAIDQIMHDVSSQLHATVLVRPYILGVNRVVENFGSLVLPPATKARDLQILRSVKRIPTAIELLGFPYFNFVAVAAEIRNAQKILKTILDKHDDFKTVKSYPVKRASITILDGYAIRHAREQQHKQRQDVARDINRQFLEAGATIKDDPFYYFSSYYLSVIERSAKVAVVTAKAKRLAKALGIPLKHIKIFQALTTAA